MLMVEHFERIFNVFFYYLYVSREYRSRGSGADPGLLLLLQPLVEQDPRLPPGRLQEEQGRRKTKYVNKINKKIKKFVVNRYTFFMNLPQRKFFGLNYLKTKIFS